MKQPCNAHAYEQEKKEQQKQFLIDMMQKDEELGLYDIFNDEKRQGVKELIDKHKQEAALKEALLELRKTPMTFEPEQETLEKYSERFDNDKSEIGNPDTWGKRVKQETLEEASWKFNPLKKLDGEFLRHAFIQGAKSDAARDYWFNIFKKK